MFTFVDSLRDVTAVSIVLRLLLSVVLGGLIGLERSAKNRPAGLRTHILVCLAAASAAITGHYLYLNMKVSSDLTRIGAQVIAGMGFLGAGTIIKTNHDTIKGLTTAAGLWATGIVGIAIGSGFYEGGIVAALLILLIEMRFTGFSLKVKLEPEASVKVRYKTKTALNDVLRLVKDLNINIVDLQIEHEENDEYTAKIRMRGKEIEEENFPAVMRDVTNISSVEIL